MIIQTGMRTDIPAFYAEWFCNRLRAGSVAEAPGAEQSRKRYYEHYIP